MIIDFKNLNTEKNTSLPYLRHVYTINGNYNIEIKNLRAGKNLGKGEFRNLIMAHSKGNSIKLTNVDLSRCIAPAELFRHVELNELRLDNVKFCDCADLTGYFSNSKILHHNLCDFNIHGVKDISFMFDRADIRNLKVDHWDTTSLEKAKWCFSDQQVDTMNLSGWDTSNLKDAEAMFKDCKIDTLILDWNNAVNLSDITRMFAYSEIGYLSLRGMNLDIPGIFSVFMGCDIKVLDLRNATLPKSDRIVATHWFNGSKIEYILYDRPDEFDQNTPLFRNKRPLVVENVDSIPYYSKYNIMR